MMKPSLNVSGASFELARYEGVKESVTTLLESWSTRTPQLMVEMELHITWPVSNKSLTLLSAPMNILSCERILFKERKLW